VLLAVEVLDLLVDVLVDEEDDGEPPDEDEPLDDEVPPVGFGFGFGFGGFGKILVICYIIHHQPIKCKHHGHHASSLEAMSSRPK
jgi:hypothetical protein